ncbi:MAG TPA: cyclic di-GMP phosphodiesterase [Pararobbsia sp.]|nr:cyclic di-GMP phosphodiesterase [Pararobbsia sp.]
MSGELDYPVLYAHFGTASPCWRLSSDSNALQLSAISGPATVSIALSGEQAARVRAMTGVTSHLVLDIVIFGNPLQIHLVGKKINFQEWAGTASAYNDTVSVARDLVHGLSFAEQVVSEVNSLVVILDQHGNIQRFNRLCEEVTGVREEDVVGKNAYAMFMTPEQGHQSSQNISGFFRTGEAYEVERLINTIAGPRLYLFRNKFVQSGSGVDEKFLICSGSDITEERRAQARLSELANTDALTSLPNRNAIHDRIRRALATEGMPLVGILFLDLDNFKRVNDHYGHVIGDRLIKDVASAIKECLGEGEVVARLGGDEFIVLAQGKTSAELEEIAQRILDRMRIPFNLGLIEVYTGCSIGIALSPSHSDTLEGLIRCADTAMYVAKEAGKRTYRVFSPDMNKKVAEYMWLDTNLPRALEDNQLVLHYQPKISLETGEVLGVEALVRWNSPERGLVSPLDFIPYAEESGMIGPLGRWVMQTAATQARRWSEQGHAIRVAINVSARQLSDTAIVHDLTDALDTAGLHPCLLDLELTESCLIEDEEMALGLITQFREMGAQVHLDDFGTGYSSLSQLARIPLDVIKLDRSFVRGININAKSQALVRSMVAVAQALNFRVVAEGVETTAEEEFIRKVGIDYAQGYLYAKPMTADVFETWLTEKQKLRLIA